MIPSRLTLILIGVILFLLLGLGFAGDYIYQQHNENSRLSNNLEAKDAILKSYKAKDGSIVASMPAQILTKSELKNAIGEELKNLKIPARQVVNYTTIKQVDTSSFTSKGKDTTLKVKLKDSVVFVKVKKFQHIDAHDSIIAFLLPDSTEQFFKKHWQKLTVVVRDKRKWFLGKKHPECDVHSDDPNDSVTNIECLEAEKKHKFFLWNWIFD